MARRGLGCLPGTNKVIATPTKNAIDVKNRTEDAESDLLVFIFFSFKLSLLLLDIEARGPPGIRGDAKDLCPATNRKGRPELIESCKLSHMQRLDH